MKPLNMFVFTGFKPVFAMTLQVLCKATSFWVLVGIVAFMSVTSPVTARFTPEILAVLSDPAVVEALAGSMPEPSWQSALDAWVKNLNQVCAFAVIVVGSLSLHAHLNSGQASVILARHVSRAAYISAFLIAFVGALLPVLLLTALLTWGASASIFGVAPPLPFVYAGVTWWLFAVMLVAVMTLAAAISTSIAAPLGAGVLGYLGLTLGGLWHDGARLSPFGLLGVLRGFSSQEPFAPHPVWTSVVTIILFTLASVALFSRKAIEN